MKVSIAHKEAMKFIRDHKEGPFFCYLPYTLPHGLWGMPKDDPSWLKYKDIDFKSSGQSRPTDPNIYAAMIHLADRQMGEILELLNKYYNTAIQEESSMSEEDMAIWLNKHDKYNHK